MGGDGVLACYDAYYITCSYIKSMDVYKELCYL